MLSLPFNAQLYSSKARNFFLKRTEGFEKQIFLFGVIFFINYPLYYLIWVYAEAQSYENLAIRCIASTLCLPLIFVRYWPKKLRSFLPFYWYITVTFCLPFFFTFMTIMNQGTVVWLLNLVLALLLIFILLDFISLLCTVFVGTVAAFAGFYYLSPSPLVFNPGTINLSGALATFIAALVVGGIFARNQESIVSEKLRRRSEAANQAKTEFIANMSHDIRTPITGIIGLAQSLLHEVHSIRNQTLQNSNAPPTGSNVEATLNKLLTLVEGSAQSLIEATDELLQLSNDVLESIDLDSGSLKE